MVCIWPLAISDPRYVMLMELIPKTVLLSPLLHCDSAFCGINKTFTASKHWSNSYCVQSKNATSLNINTQHKLLQVVSLFYGDK